MAAARNIILNVIFVLGFFLAVQGFFNWDSICFGGSICTVYQLDYGLYLMALGVGLFEISSIIFLFKKKWKIVPMTAAKAGLFLSFALFVDELLFVGGWPYLGLRLNFDGIMGPTSPVIAVAGMGVSSVYLSRKKSRDYNEMQRKGEREKAAALLVSKAKKNEKSDS